MNLSSKDIAALPERARRAIQAARAKPTRYPVPPVAAKGRRRKAGDGQSGLEKTFVQRWLLAGGEQPTAQVKFHPSRNWRIDWAFCDVQVGIEIHGGTWSGGRHVRGKGFQEDREKLREAMRLGWLVFELTSKDLEYPVMERIAEIVFARRLALGLK